ncbi:MAG: phenylalanine--tRNA ligase subunit beta [Spirochaetia bacterium]
MYISTEWIQDYVDIKNIEPDALAERFTLATCEVEGYETAGELFEKVRVAKVTAVEPHPNADKLKVVTFSLGGGESGKVVCGAPNVAAGQKVPFAPVGVTLPVGFTLERKEIRGVVSEGMLCAEDELGLSDDHEGLMELRPETPEGITMAEYLGTTRTIILDIDNKSITHRPDLWGQYGMAREFAAVFGKPPADRFNRKWEEQLLARFNKEKSPVSVEVREDSCGRAYFGYTVSGIKVGESPAWMKRRLTDCGLRPINSIVDISNYVMLELGMPNHIFDRKKIEGDAVIIRSLKEEIEFTTLDGETRKLIPGDTVVADKEKPLVIAGIMGGLYSGVTALTDEIFVEAANWDPALIRRTSTRIGLRTDSSLRFEKTLDSLQCRRTALRILELVLELNPDAKVTGALEYDGDNLEGYQPLVIRITPEHICNVLGHQVERSRIIEILRSLEFGVEEEADTLVVTVPSFRATKDIEYPADIIEEIGRIVGFDNITPVSLDWKLEPVRLSPAKLTRRKIQDFLVQRTDALEVFTYPMVGKSLLEKAFWPDMNEELVLANALSKDHDRMRPSLIPEFLQSTAANSRNYSRFTMFEVGRSYHPDPESFSREQSQLICAFYSTGESRIMNAVNTVEQLLSRLNVPAKLVTADPTRGNPLVPAGWPGLHPYETLDIQIMGKTQGIVFSVHPLVLRNFKIKGYLSLAVINLSDIEEREMKDRRSFAELPRYPSSTFDCTVVTDPRTPVGDILEAARKLRMKEFTELKVADVFTLSEDRKTVTLRATFLDTERTLPGEFLEEAQRKLVETLENAGFPLKQ